ncbi:unnamed protein product [Paramecium sonneborni]|uniref:Uncharacterized protein n=1 Tax=Paramecium sonneborni TaxID=65129 RepID=A0A8S1KTH1_9CILI|nr:unnamed protein product [Paramecium sonneborni]
MSQSQKLSISPLKNQQPFLPTISFKTSESPSKVLIPLANYMLFEQKKDKIQAINAKQLKYERAQVIYKYLHQQILKKKDSHQQKSNQQDKTPITDSKDKIQNSKESSSSFQQLKKIIEKQSNQKILEVSQSCKNFTVQPNLSNQILNGCIVELDQEQEECEQQISYQIKNKLNISLNVYNNNFNDNNNQKQQKVILDYNQQNKAYKEKNIQIIQMIKNAQQNLLKQRDEVRKEYEKEYKYKKILRQKERREGLQNAQQGIKNRQLKSLLNALKGSTIQKSNQAQQQVQNIGRKYFLQRSQSTIISRQSSFQQSNHDYITDKYNGERLIGKISQISDVCSSETSQDSNLQIQFPIKSQKVT